MKTDISKKLLQYLAEKNFSYRTITKYTGLSQSNINLLKNKENYGITISLLTRFLAAFRNEGIIEYIFADMPEIADYLFKEPNCDTVLTEADIMLFVINLCQSWTSVDFFEIQKVFHILLRLDYQTHLHSFDFQRSSLRSEVNYNFFDGEAILIPVLNCFYQIPPHDESPKQQYLKVSSYYPYFEGFDWHKKMLESGETITWSDISVLMTRVRLASGKSSEKLNKHLKVAAGMIIRLEMEKSRTYSLDDICKIDDYIEADGKFLALCIRASQNSILLNKAFEYEKIIDENNLLQVLSKDTIFDQVSYANRSFIKLIRDIEYEDFLYNTGLTKWFLQDFRSYFSEKRSDQYDILKSFTENNIDFFSSKDPLSIYRHDSEEEK